MVPLWLTQITTYTSRLSESQLVSTVACLLFDAKPTTNLMTTSDLSHSDGIKTYHRHYLIFTEVWLEGTIFNFTTILFKDGGDDELTWHTWNHGMDVFNDFISRWSLMNGQLWKSNPVAHSTTDEAIVTGVKLCIFHWLISTELVQK